MTIKPLEPQAKSQQPIEPQAKSQEPRALLRLAIFEDGTISLDYMVAPDHPVLMYSLVGALYETTLAWFEDHGVNLDRVRPKQ